MTALATFVASGSVAALFGFTLSIAQLYDAFQPMIVALSIMIAAILVRLNRGMPTLDWKSLDPVERARLTGKIVDLTKEYISIISIYGVFLFILVVLIAGGRENLSNMWPYYAQRGGAAVVGGLGVLCIFRMSYVVWRDYDIVKLQKKLIDDAGLKEQYDLEVKSADSKIADIRSAGLRKVASSEPKPWS